MQSEPIQLLDADLLGFALARGKLRWVEAWDAVDQILIARVDWGDNENTALVAAISIGGGDRAIILCEIQPEWTIFMAAAQMALPGFLNQGDWEPAVSLAERGLVIFDREGKAHPTIQ